ncbi:hypothetical protein C1H46_044293 [Malus baccata]|uniref:Exportin-5 C-terminal domain-containing protein n=1 Tax=Malus baccata TaxID=106549 RepID=A0A540K7G0_MALBA|nr:hypothetical protein C1H46_044293 [Malus baccata]
MEESSNSNTAASSVAQAIAVALDWSSTPDARKEAVAFLESIKTGDVRILANAALLLVKKDWSSEIRLHAFKMLQHLVRLRWEELSPTERRNFANITVDLMSDIASPSEEWALKSQTAALTAEVYTAVLLTLFKLPVMVRREGLNLWQELFPTLVSLSSKGPIQAELVSMMLRWLPEDITVHNEDLEGDRRRLLLRGLTQSLPEILPLLYTMLGFFQHFKLALHFQSLNFWLALMRDLMSKPKAVAHSAGDGSDRVDFEKRKILSFLNDEICSAILDVSFQHMLKREKVIHGTTFSLGQLELWSDDVEDKGTFGQYRSKLLELIKLVALYKPLIAGSKVSERIDTIIKSLLLSPMPAQDLAVMESMQLALENVVSTIFDGSNEIAGGHSEVQLGLCRIFEGLLQQLLSLKWTEPALVEVLGHYLDAMGSFLKYFPDAVGSVINKLFELLNSLPFVVKDPSTSSARYARLQICTSFIRIAKTADTSVLPHMKGIADTMAYMKREGSLLRGEHNLLGEAFLVMASASGIQQQQEVLAWLLEPLSQQWTQIEWQNNYLSEPLGLVRLCSETPVMWSVFHTITFFEKALKRSGTRKAQSNLQHNSTESSMPLHPMASHLSWMLPPLPKLFRVLHSLWSPSVFQILPGEIKAAMTMSDVEKFSLLGEGNPKLLKGTIAFANGSHISASKEGYVESNESDIRNWLKGIRDSGFLSFND